MEHWKERNTKWNGTVKRIEENDQGLRNLIVDSVVFNPEVGQNLAPLHAHWISALSLNSCLRKIVAQGVHLDVDSASLLLHSVSSHPTLKVLLFFFVFGILLSFFFLTSLLFYYSYLIDSLPFSQ